MSRPYTINAKRYTVWNTEPKEVREAWVTKMRIYNESLASRPKDIKVIQHTRVEKPEEDHEEESYNWMYVRTREAKVSKRKSPEERLRLKHEAERRIREINLHNKLARTRTM